MNTFSADIRYSSCIQLPSGEFYAGPALHVFLIPFPGSGLCAIARASILEVPPGLLPEVYPSDLDMRGVVVPLLNIDWSHPFMVNLKLECCQDWFRKLTQLRKDLDASEQQLRTMLAEQLNAAAF